MRLTKYEHACIVLEDQGNTLVIDPGVLSSSFQVPNDVVGIVITHQHPDHIDQKNIQKIIDTYPSAVIFAPHDVANAYPQFSIQPVEAGTTKQLGSFRLAFFGGQHAVIHPSKPVVQNMGVLVNETFYYPGDSFALPHRGVKTLAIPAGAPWMKIQEAMDYLTDVKAALNIPTHDAVLSEAGQSFHDMWLQTAAESIGAEYRRVQPGETIEI